MKVQLYDLKGIAIYVLCKNTVLIDSNLPEAERQELISNLRSCRKECFTVAIQ